MRLVPWLAVFAAFIAFGLAGATLAQPIVTGDLSVYYDFDDFVDEIEDKSGNGLNGEIFGNVIFSDDAVRGGGSAFFDSAETNFTAEHNVAIAGCTRDTPLECGDIPAELIPSSAFTLAAWMKVEDSTGGDQSVYQVESADGSFVTHAQLQNDGRIRMRLRSQLQSDNINSTDKWNIDGLGGSETYPLGEWFHYAGTFSQAENLIRFFYTGEVVFEMEPDGNAFDAELGDWGRGALLGTTTDAGRQLYARMDELYVFTRALSDAEIKDLFELNEPGGPPQLQAGDADENLAFDQFDLIKVQQAAKYLTGDAATWGEGDWNAAPGGAAGSPPAGDGLFNQLDIIAALNNGLYLQGPYAALSGDGTAGDGQTSIIYNVTTGELGVDAPAGTDLTSININSAAGVFTGDAAQNLGGSFDNDADLPAYDVNPEIFANVMPANRSHNSQNPAEPPKTGSSGNYTKSWSNTLAAIIPQPPCVPSNRTY